MTHKSRWGYHPCDVETYRLLKRVAFLCFLSLRRDREWERWYRKAPHNRRRSISPHGTAKRCRAYEPVPEPARSDVHGSWYQQLRRDCRTARQPAATPENVSPLQTSLEDLKALRSLLETWFQAHGPRTLRRQPVPVPAST